jgi:Zn-finger nucleic acid-binding protein
VNKFNYCPKCGTSLSEYFVHEDEDIQFCPNCKFGLIPKKNELSELKKNIKTPNSLIYIALGILGLILGIYLIYPT